MFTTVLRQFTSVEAKVSTDELHTTTDAQKVTTVEPNITTGEPTFTTGEPTFTTVEHKFTTDEPKFTTDEPNVSTSAVTTRPTTSTPITTTTMGSTTTTTADYCNNEPCLSGGTCVSNPDNTYYCQCPDWYIGIHCEIVVSSHDITVSKAVNATYIENDPLYTSCAFVMTFNDTSSPRDYYVVDVVWMLKDIVLSTHGRINITTDVSITNDSVSSSLAVKYLVSADKGPLACTFTVRNAAAQYDVIGSEEVSQNFDVTTLPVMHLSPRSAFIETGETISFECTVKSGSGADITEWFVNEEKSNTTGKTLTYAPVGAGESHVKCRGCLTLNDACGPDATSSVIAIELLTDPCPEGNDTYWIYWGSCPAGEELIGECPSGQTGNSSRRCLDEDGEPVWEETNLFNCVESDVADVTDQIDYIIDVGANDTAAIENTLGELEEAIEPEPGDDVKEIPPGNINSAAKSMSSLAEARSSVEGAQVSEKEVQAIVNITSSLLSPSNDDSWSRIIQEDPAIPHTLVTTVDTYAELRADMLLPGEAEQLEDENLSVNIQIYDQDHKEDDIVFPLLPGVDQKAYNLYHKASLLEYTWMRDKVIIPAELMTKIYLYLNSTAINPKVSASAIFYRTIHHVMPQSVTNDTDRLTNDPNAPATWIGSQVLSIVMPHRLPITYVLDPPIIMKLHYNESQKDGWQGVPSCMYYMENETLWSVDGLATDMGDNKNVTCYTNHTTNFGVIMRPDLVLSDIHETVLTWLTHTFLILSTICMIVTISVYGAYWKNLRSHHGVLLINLSVSLICGHVIFMIEAWRDPGEPWMSNTTSSEKDLTQDPACIAIGALMHFFYLAGFFIMLAEGIQILIYVTFVFHSKRYRETYGLIAGAWSASAVIVAITLGVTQGDGYGPSDNGGSCWLQLNADYSGSFWAFAGPMMVIIVVNLVIACIVQYKSVKSSQLTKTQRERVRTGVWNLMVLCPVLGISWIFGIFTLTNAAPEVTLAFLYLFTIFATLQGFFILLFHCILNEKVRKLMRSCGKMTSDSHEVSDTRRRAYQTRSTSQGTKQTTSGEASTSGDFSDINKGFEPDTPATVHREGGEDHGTPSLYTQTSQNLDACERIAHTDNYDAVSQQASLPGYLFQVPQGSAPQPVDWESLVNSHADEYTFDNNGFVEDNYFTYF